MEPAGEFQSLYQRHSGDVFRFAMYLSGNRHDAEDITSETFVRAWTAAAEIRAETVRAYLFTIARNLYLHGLRRVRRQVELDESLRDPSAGPGVRAEESSELAVTLKSLQRLSELDRTALVLRAFHELPYTEVAQTLGISVGAARVRVHRARLALLELRNPPPAAPAPGDRPGE